MIVRRKRAEIAFFSNKVVSVSVPTRLDVDSASVASSSYFDHHHHRHRHIKEILTLTRTQSNESICRGHLFLRSFCTVNWIKAKKWRLVCKFIKRNDWFEWNIRRKIDEAIALFGVFLWIYAVLTSQITTKCLRCEYGVCVLTFPCFSINNHMHHILSESIFCSKLSN